MTLRFGPSTSNDLDMDDHGHGAVLSSAWLVWLFCLVVFRVMAHLVCCFPEVGITVGRLSKSEVRGCSQI